jgi:hypothetical protein
MTKRFLVSASLALALVACGGEDGGTPPPTGGGGTPTPTPTPTPSPTPTPTYQTFAQLTGDRTFNKACAGYRQGQSIAPITASEFGEGISQGRGLALGFTAATSTWNITGPGFTTSFGPADLAPTQPADTTFYSRLVNGAPERFAIVSRPFGTQPAEYVRGSSVTFPAGGGIEDYFCVFGVPTLATDPLPSSTITFTQFNVGGRAIRVTPAGGAIFDLRDSTVTLSANPATLQVTTQITLVGREFVNGTPSATLTQFGTYSSTGAINSRPSFAGALASAGQTVIDSNFSGWFFGPQGREAGYAFNVVVDLPEGGRLTSAGAVTARR